MRRWNEDKLATELAGPRGDVVAMRAVCAIFRRQTQDERATATTRHTNGVGFAQNDARVGTTMARWMDCGQGDGILRRRVGGFVIRTDGTHQDRIELCKTLAWKYRRQLLNEAARVQGQQAA